MNKPRSFSEIFERHEIFSSRPIHFERAIPREVVVSKRTGKLIRQMLQRQSAARKDRETHHE